MAYNKASEERKWRYWKEQEEKKLRELGMGEEKIRELRQMDWEDFWKNADTGNGWKERCRRLILENQRTVNRLQWMSGNS